jgi:protein SCO1/2
MSIARTAAACVIVLAGAAAVGHWATDGYRAFTYESARRLRAIESPRPLPADLALDLDDGRSLRLNAWRESVLVVDFVYARCATLCQSLGSDYARLSRHLAREIADGRVRLLTVSFDVQRDDAAALAAYRSRHAPQATGWDLGRPPDGGALRRWLDAFGVVVVPDGRGDFAHNAAIAVVGPDRRLRALVDVGDVDGVIEHVRRLLTAAEADADA